MTRNDFLVVVPSLLALLVSSGCVGPDAAGDLSEDGAVGEAAQAA